jgi:aspartate aminotransferase
MKIAQRVQHVKPSPTLAVTQRAEELKRQGYDIISLGAGEPDFPTPDHICYAAVQAITHGKTYYTAVDGISELKQAIIQKFARDNQLNYKPEQIVVSTGAKQSIYNAMQALIEEGDEVIIPVPYWVSYPDMVKLAEGVPVFVHADLSQNFKITPAQLAAAITDKTRMVILNSPSNPSGACYSAPELKALGEVLLQHPNIIVLSDDIYESIIWEGQFHHILNQVPALVDRTLVLNGVSKAYSMTGWRIGYIAGAFELIQPIKTIQSQSTSNACSIAQYASVAALNGHQDFIQDWVAQFKTRHDFVVAALQAIDGVEVKPSQGAFYSFPNMQGVIDRLGLQNDLELADLLLTQAQVAAVSGSAFGLEGYLRFSFATCMENLEKAFASIQKVLA